MINEALSFIQNQTHLYFQGLHGASTVKYVELGNIAKIVESGEPNEDADQVSLIITLVNIEEDRISKNPDGIYREVDKVIKRNPKIHLNLYLLFSSNANTYSTALSQISNVIQCFQSKNFFPKVEFPTMDPGIDKLHMELYTMNFEQINHLWSTLGGKYLPSVLYKLKMVTIYDKDNFIDGDLISEIDFKKKSITSELL